MKIHVSRVGVFKKNYEETSSPKIYHIANRFAPGNSHLYSLKTDKNESLDGRFTASQLIGVNLSEKTVYRIGKIVRKRIKGVKYVKVEWLGYDT